MSNYTIIIYQNMFFQMNIDRPAVIHMEALLQNVQEFYAEFFCSHDDFSTSHRLSPGSVGGGGREKREKKKHIPKIPKQFGLQALKKL